MLINSIQLSKNRATAVVNTAMLICQGFDRGQRKKKNPTTNEEKNKNTFVCYNSSIRNVHNASSMPQL